MLSFASCGRSWHGFLSIKDGQSEETYSAEQQEQHRRQRTLEILSVWLLWGQRNGAVSVRSE